MNEQTDIRPEGENNAAPTAPAKKSKLDFSNIEINLLSKNFIKSAALVLISLLLLIFAFCPVINYKATTYITYYDDDYDMQYEKYKISIGQSAGKGIGLFFDALQSKSDKKIQKLDLYDDLEDVMEDYKDEYADVKDDEGDVTRDLKKLQKKYMKMALRLTLKSEEVSPTIDGYFLPFIALAYMIGAIALFLFALLNLFYEIMGIDNLTGIKLLSRSSVSSLCYKLLAAIPALIIILFGFMFVGFGVNDIYMMTGILFKGRLAFTALLSLILSIGAFIALMVLRVIDKEIVIDRCAKRRIISAVLAIVFLFVAFAPFASAKIDGDYTVTEDSMKLRFDANTFQGFRLEDYSMFRVVPNGASYYTIGDLDIDILDEDEADALKFVFTMMVLPWLAMVVFAAVILAINVYQLGTTITKGKKQLGIRIANMIISTIVAGILGFWSLTFAIAGSDSEYLDGRFSITFIFYIVTAILYLVFTPVDPKEPEAEAVAEAEAEVAAPAEDVQQNA